MKINTDKIAIVIPCFNEDGNIDHIVNQLESTLSEFDCHILFVNDGSTDNTLAKIKNVATYNERIKYLSLSRNFGHQNALKAGIDFCTEYDCVISMDADTQHPPESIILMIEKWHKGYEIVNSIRKDNRHIPVLKKKFAGVFYALINLISVTKIIPNSPDFRLLDKKVVKVLSGFNENNIFMRELIPWLGFKQTTIEFVVGERFSGKSKYNFKKQLSFSLTGIVSSSISPLRFSMLLGGFFGSLTIVYGLYLIYVHLFTQETIPGWTSVIVTILFVAGVQFFLLGIIGEYLGKTFLETRKRPLYLVGETNLEIAPEVNEISVIR